MDAGLIIKSYCVEHPHIPLQSYQDNDVFKVYLLDVGLLGAMMKLAPQTLLQGNELFTHAKGALIENGVAQELFSLLREPIRYWASPGTAEVDFIVSVLLQKKELILPIEAKSGISTKNKSLIEYNRRHSPAFLTRLNTLNLSLQKNTLNVPLYLIQSLPNLWSKARPTLPMENSNKET